MRRLLIASLLFALAGPLAAQHNPFLDKKSKNRPSARMARSDKRELKKQKKLAKKQMRRSKRSIARANRQRMKGN